VNGDGKADLVQVYAPNGNVYVALSTGNSFGSFQVWATSPGGGSPGAGANPDIAAGNPAETGAAAITAAANPALPNGGAVTASTPDLALLTNYMASSFAGASASSGQPLFSDPAQMTQQPTLASQTHTVM
jgi:hypothetical protein